MAFWGIDLKQETPVTNISHASRGIGSAGLESYGIDIANSYGEQSVQGSEEDTYEDSFIDDDEARVYSSASLSSDIDKKPKERNKQLKKRNKTIDSEDERNKDIASSPAVEEDVLKVKIRKNKRKNKIQKNEENEVIGVGLVSESNKSKSSNGSGDKNLEFKSSKATSLANKLKIEDLETVRPVGKIANSRKKRTRKIPYKVLLRLKYLEKKNNQTHELRRMKLEHEQKMEAKAMEHAHNMEKARMETQKKPLKDYIDKIDQIGSFFAKLEKYFSEKGHPVAKSPNGLSVPVREVSDAQSSPHLIENPTYLPLEVGTVVELLNYDTPKKLVAEAVVQSKNPQKRVGDEKLGDEFWEVCIKKSVLPCEPLWIHGRVMLKIEDAIGQSVAWPKENIRKK